MLHNALWYGLWLCSMPHGELWPSATGKFLSDPWLERLDSIGVTVHTGHIKLSTVTVHITGSRRQCRVIMLSVTIWWWWWWWWAAENEHESRRHPTVRRWPAAVGRCLPGLDHHRGGASDPGVHGGRVPRRAANHCQLDEVPVGRTPAAGSGRLTAVTLITQTAPQRTNCAAEIVRHEAVDERIDRALRVRKQVDKQLSTWIHTQCAFYFLITAWISFKRLICTIQVRYRKSPRDTCRTVKLKLTLTLVLTLMLVQKFIHYMAWWQ